MENEFNFLNLNSNDNLSSMKSSDVSEFLKELRDYKLALRDTINLPDDYKNPITFGLEIEFENIKNLSKFRKKVSNLEFYPSYFLDEEVAKEVYYRRNKFWNRSDERYKYIKIDSDEVFLWCIGKDGSLTKGAEITSPILIDDVVHWKDLQSICKIISEYAEISNHCAGHVHVGSHVLGSNYQNWLNLVYIWCAYENIAYRFGYNEFLGKLPGISHCRPLAHALKGAVSYLDDAGFEEFIDFLSIVRSQAINFQNVVSGDDEGVIPCETIEFRSPNGTLDPVIWQNNVNFFTKLLLYCKSDRFDIDTVARRMSRVHYSDKYGNIYRKQALELADMVFDNNLDKVYFLRQYFKDFDVSNKPMAKTKKFTI